MSSIFMSMTIIARLSSFLLVTLSFTHCSNNLPEKKYSKLEISDRLIEQYGSTETGTGYSHNLILKNFNPDLYTENNLIAFGDNYIDTVSTGKPIFSITICKPFELEKQYDSRDIGPIRDHAIISINYNSYDPELDRLPIITGMILWIDGKPIEISPLDKDERQKTLKYHQNRSR
jgi:hypothetical protein